MTSMTSRVRHLGVLLLAVLIVVIAFSSSSLAARWLDDGVCNAFTLFFGTGIAGDSPVYQGTHFVIEKGSHLAMYFGFGFILSIAWPGASKRKFLWICLTGLAMGIASELLQFLFPGRDPALRDVAINLAGTVLGAMAARRYGGRCGWERAERVEVLNS